MKSHRCKVYISGPITGKLNLNVEAFDKAVDVLRHRGFSTVNPHDLETDKTKSYAHYMKLCLVALMQCDSIYMLDGWEASRGARLEHRVAVVLGLTVHFASEENHAE